MNARSEALAAGLKHYQGAPCKYGHLERYTSDCKCVVCKCERTRMYGEANPEKVREKNVAYYAANREKAREKNAAYRAANVEKAREQSRAYYAANKEKLREQRAAYYAANQEKKREYDAEYRAANQGKVRERHAAYYTANQEKRRENARRWRKNNHGACRAYGAKRRALEISQRCGCCSDEEIQKVYDITTLCGPGAEADHRTPLALGGLHCAKNLQALTYEEHKVKTRRDKILIADARRSRANLSPATQTGSRSGHRASTAATAFR